MYRMTDEEFEVAVAEALDAMPEQFMEALQNVAVVWEEEPSAYHLGHDEEWGAEMRDAEGEDESDVITVFKGPHERCFDSREEIVEEVGKTIIHELGHYFGLSEDQLAAMGYE